MTISFIFYIHMQLIPLDWLAITLFFSFNWNKSWKVMTAPLVTGYVCWFASPAIRHYFLWISQGYSISELGSVNKPCDSPYLQFTIAKSSESRLFIPASFGTTCTLHYSCTIPINSDPTLWVSRQHYSLSGVTHQAASGRPYTTIDPCIIITLLAYSFSQTRNELRGSSRYR